MNILKSLVLLTFCFNVNAYDSVKCSRIARNALGVMVSTSSYVSSTGDCAAIGKTQEQKRFLVQNFENLKKDISRSGGEYLTSFSKLANCDAFTLLELPNRLRINLKQIYGDDFQSNAEDVYNRISELVRADKELSCKYLGS